MLKIITDSSSDLRLDEYREKNIELISLNVTFGDKSYKEESELSKEQFYELLFSSESFPKTSQPSPYDLMSILEDAKKNNDEVLGIFLSSKVSGTYNSCMMIKNTVELDDCYFIDSLTGSCGLRILLDEAVKLREQGKNAKEIAERIEVLKHHIKLYVVADTLDYLAKGGRISSFSSKIGNLLKFKPLLEVKDGKVEVLSKPRGLKSAMEELILQIVNDQVDDDYPVYAIYSIAKDNVLKLVEKLALTGIDVPLDNIYLIGAAIGTHLGPNGFGLVYVSKV